MKKLLSLILLGTLFVGLNSCMSTTKTKDNVLIKNKKGEIDYHFLVEIQKTVANVVVGLLDC